jgi:hydroxymethylpyrimidine/phosphomethylpyrimidine kinase
MHIAMTIAGSDSGGGAGIQADLKTFAAHGVWGTSAIAAITAQNTTGVTAALPLPVDLIVAQMEAVATDMRIDAVKTGMLATSAIVTAVADALGRLSLPNIVVDPVMVAKSGARLLEDDAVAAVRERLLPRAMVVTPNAEEAEVLAGMAVGTTNDAREAARRIHRLGPRAVVIKGGHIPGDEVIDLLFDGREFVEFRSARIDSGNTHGTGCTFAAAIAANLARGLGLADATRRAKDYVEGAIRGGHGIGHGVGVLDHFWSNPPRR